MPDQEKTFLEIRLVNKKNQAFGGRRYKLEMPDGRTEQGVLGADGKIYKSGIDPGTARFTLLAGEGKSIHAAEPETTPAPAPEPAPKAAEVNLDFA
jgi:hypothetical protein